MTSDQEFRNENLEIEGSEETQEEEFDNVSDHKIKIKKSRKVSCKENFKR